MKERHDVKHKPIYLRPGDKVYLRLYYGYEVSGQKARKYSHQREGAFKVIERVGRLAYRLDLLLIKLVGLQPRDSIWRLPHGGHEPLWHA